MNDLYGDHVRPTYDTDPTLQPELFTQAGGTGSAWMGAAQAWADKHGLPITSWQADQRFSTPRRIHDKNGARFVKQQNYWRIIWNEETHKWQVCAA